jgi:hypothetical protein
MIIFGRRGRTSTKDRGQFTCPKCAQHGAYELKQVRTWFTLYFIPVFPLNAGVLFVECGACRTHFTPEVLKARLPMVTEADAIAAELRRASARCMAFVLLQAGRWRDEELTVAGRCYRDVTSNSLPEADLLRELHEVQANPEAFLRYLNNFASHLETEVKERILTAAARLGRATGIDSPEDNEAFVALTRGLGISAAHAHGIFALGASSAVA